MRREQKQLPEREISFFDGAVARSAPREGGQGEGTARKQRPGSPRFITALTTPGEFATYFQPLLLFPSFFFSFKNNNNDKPFYRKTSTKKTPKKRRAPRNATRGSERRRERSDVFPVQVSEPLSHPHGVFPYFKQSTLFSAPGAVPSAVPGVSL